MPRSTSEQNEKAGYEKIQVGRVYLTKTPASPYWYLRWCHQGTPGRKSLGTTNKKFAEKLAREHDAKLVLGQLEAPKRQRNERVDVALQKWFKWLPNQRVKSKTIDNYRRPCEQLLFWTRQRLGREPRLADLTIERLHAFEDELREHGVVVQSGRKRRQAKCNQAGTLEQKMQAIRRFIRWSVDYELVGSDPSRKYRVPARNHPDVEIYTPAEIAGLLADPDENLRDIWLTLLRTGMRASELFWLTKEDVDLDQRLIYIRRKVCPLTDEVWEPKHRHERVIPFSDDELALALDRQMKRSSGPWVFSTGDNWKNNGGRWREGRLLARLRRQQKRVGITHGTLHTCRHTCLSFLSNNPSMTPAQVMQFAGHRDLKTTMGYIHVKPGDVRRSLVSVDFSRMAAGHDAGNDRKEPAAD